MNQKNFLICLVGLPASGKSSFAKLLKLALKNKYSYLEVIIIDPDIIRYDMTGEYFDHNKENIVREQNLNRIRIELEKGKIVLSDDLNYFTSMRHDLKEIADALNLRFFIIYISTPPEVCIKWNEERGKPIPNAVITRIHNKFDNFNKYHWDRPIGKYNLSKINDKNKIIQELLEKVEKELKETVEEEIIYDKSNEYNEKLDKITRNLVKEFLVTKDYLVFKKNIISLRKNYLKEYKNCFQTELEIKKTFREYVEKHLNKKIN
ncbi:MAG: AAA family ATPase [Promethearchaeota archaeon]